ncbi:hypothetical protein Cpap_3754 [Ruminiclostridium papyrosolvens DSM 2782]|uniref:Uncharacterized protein n=1 Tax=Ruminiclostridium papyrosolvens DSM 2782 TaxID=588581 RepID=F1T774_9FIRM|nr:hypothetical protein [Ruminiclostridium papyrosolvens]EGD49322.1 hypothetical protein Cpap_3754 [Ruminiclostridium papyrosolvens DSM 2782]WES33549.1 hypothetical protein P0092_17535 [Ruminiclostridium papyrosolvens DSM 2782]
MMNNNCCNKFFSLSPSELTLLATVISLAVAEELDNCQRNVFGNFLTSVAQNILTYDSQDSCIKNNCT